MRDPKSLARFYETTNQIVTIDRESPPRVLFSGEDLLLEDLPVGTRVIYPKPPLAGLPNVKAAIRYAINHPDGCDPLHAKLRPGMKVTIAIDDISLPAAADADARRARARARRWSCHLLADHGVDDVHIDHRDERPPPHDRARRSATMVGDEIFDAYYPDRYYNHDAEDPDGHASCSARPTHGEKVDLNRRAVESDLLIYVNLNLVPMDGGHKSVAVGLCGYESLKAHHNPQTMRKCHSYMDPERSALHRSVERMGRLRRREPQRLHTSRRRSTTGCSMGRSSSSRRTRTTTPSCERLKLAGMRAALKRLPPAARRSLPDGARALRRHRRVRGRDRAHAREDPREELRAVRGGRGLPGGHPHLRASRTSPRTT